MENGKYSQSNLRSPGSPEDAIYTLSKTVALPYSAHSRSVYFFPKTKRGKGKIILGSLHDRQPRPPVVIYLRNEDAEDWSKAEGDILTTEEPYSDASAYI